MAILFQKSAKVRSLIALPKTSRTLLRNSSLGNMATLVISKKTKSRDAILPRDELRRSVRLVFGSAMSDRTFADFWNKIAIKCYSRTSYPVLEHLFLLQNDLSCFRTSYFVNTLKMLKNC
jgi:hypothetical protein